MPANKLYRAKRANLLNPFTHQTFTTAMPGVPATEDSWLQLQVERGLIEEIDQEPAKASKAKVTKTVKKES